MPQKRKKPVGRPRDPKRWIPDFLKALARYGVVSYAVKAAGIHKATAYKLRDRDTEFAERWDDAVDEAIDALEVDVFKRARGEEEPVLDSKGMPVMDPHTGQPITVPRPKSDTLAIFMLKANRPSKFRDNYNIERVAEQLANASNRLAGAMASGGAQGAPGS